MKTLAIFLLTLHAQAFEIGAHKGMYTPLAPGYEPERDDCVAEHMGDPALRPPAIRYTLENSLAAISAAFAHHADRSSINLQLSEDGEVVLFHDRTLDCKTDGSGFVRDYSLKELKELNMGFDYVFRGAHPWRDPEIIRRGYTKITTLDELMAVHSDKAYWIVIRPSSPEELAAILGKLKPYKTAVAKSMLFIPMSEPWIRPTVEEVLPEIAIPRIDMVRNRLCRKSIAPGKELPGACKNLEFVIQAKDAISLGAYLGDLGLALQREGSSLVIGTEEGGFVETIEQAKSLLPYRNVIMGMMTNRIDLIGPYVKGER